MTPGSAVSVMQVGDAFLRRDGGDALRHADAEIDDGVGLQLERRAAGDDLALAHLQRPQRVHGHADLAGKGRRIVLGEGLHVVLAPLGDDHAIDQDAGDLDLARVEAAALGDALDLDDDAARRSCAPPWRSTAPPASAPRAPW